MGQYRHQNIESNVPAAGSSRGVVAKPTRTLRRPATRSDDSSQGVVLVLLYFRKYRRLSFNTRSAECNITYKGANRAFEPEGTNKRVEKKTEQHEAGSEGVRLLRDLIFVKMNSSSDNKAWKAAGFISAQKALRRDQQGTNERCD